MNKNSSAPQLELFEKDHAPQRDSSTTFLDNRKLPIHRWFRYSAGFSGSWASRLIKDNCNADSLVLDPFVGCGTTVLAAQEANISSIGIEAHHFVKRIADAKLCWRESVVDFHATTKNIIKDARSSNFDAIDTYPELIRKIYSGDALRNLARLYLSLPSSSNPSIFLLSWLLIISILRQCSNAGTAPWQYVLPRKSKSRVNDPFSAMETQAKLMIADMNHFQSIVTTSAEIFLDDARTFNFLPKSSVDFVVTSPPYPNNYDYADSTRIEMSFTKEISRWSDLHDSVRRNLICSCSQHSAKEHSTLNSILADNYLSPIVNEISEVCGNLENVRLIKAGKKTYHTMVASYFADMSRVFERLSFVVKNGGKMCFVIGDSAPYGVYVPVDKWLSELSRNFGFRTIRFDETRKRNVKWKNRKHRVPLKEGHLWLEKR